MPNFSLYILVAHEFIRLSDWASELEGTLLAQYTQVKNESIVLEDETSELESSNETIRVRMTHVFVGDNHIVLGGHVVCQIVIHDQP